MRESCTGGRRWNGLLEVLFAGGDVTAGSAPAWPSFLKNGFFVSASDWGLVIGKAVVSAACGTGATTVGIGGAGAGGGETALVSNS